MTLHKSVTASAEVSSTLGGRDHPRCHETEIEVATYALRCSVRYHSVLIPVIQELHTVRWAIDQARRLTIFGSTATRWRCYG